MRASSRFGSTTWVIRRPFGRQPRRWPARERRGKKRTGLNLRSNRYGNSTRLGIGVVLLDCLFGLIGGDAQRTQKAAIVGGQVELPASRQQTRRRRDLGHSAAIVPIHEADDGFEG